MGVARSSRSLCSPRKTSLKAASQDAKLREGKKYQAKLPHWQRRPEKPDPQANDFLACQSISLNGLEGYEGCIPID